MALEKSIKLDQITVTDTGIVLYRETTTITEDGKVVSESAHRTSLTPGQNIDNQPDKVAAICSLAWTPEIISAYEVYWDEHHRRLGIENE